MIKIQVDLETLKVYSDSVGERQISISSEMCTFTTITFGCYFSFAFPDTHLNQTNLKNEMNLPTIPASRCTVKYKFPMNWWLHGSNTTTIQCTLLLINVSISCTALLEMVALTPFIEWISKQTDHAR